MATPIYERLHRRLALPREGSLRFDLRRRAAHWFLQRAGVAFLRCQLEDAQKRGLARIADRIGPWLTALITILAALVFAFCH